MLSTLEFKQRVSNAQQKPRASDINVRKTYEYTSNCGRRSV